MKQVVIHEEAEAELDDAVAYYERKRQGLGLELQEEVQQAIQRLRQHPKSFLEVEAAPGVRRCLVKKFPYTVFYEDSADDILILAVAHQKRKPGYWANRRE